MVILNVKGGLGNQLFMYATAYAVAKKYKTSIILDKQSYDTTYILRKCQLEYFNVDTECCVMKRSYGRNKIACKLYNIVHDFKLRHLYKAVYIEEKEEFLFQDIPYIANANIYLKGYWQNYHYFDSYRQEIIDLFTPKDILYYKESKLLKQIIEEKPVAVHIRRTDYKTFQGGKCLSFQYYKQAIKKMYEILGEERKLLVFTDDVDFCKEQLKEYNNVTYISDICKLSDVQEFYIMSKCSCFIIANSSFSWWAAYLNDGKDKVVIAPLVDMWKREFYLNEWFTLDALLEGETK